MGRERLVRGGQGDVRQHGAPAQVLRLGEEERMVIIPLQAEVLSRPHLEYLYQQSLIKRQNVGSQGRQVVVRLVVVVVVCQEVVGRRVGHSQRRPGGEELV